MRCLAVLCLITVLCLAVLYLAFHLPSPSRTIRQAGLKMAVSRAMIIISLYANLAMRAKATSPGGRALARSPTSALDPEQMVARAARNSIVAITGGDAKKRVHPSAVLQFMFGGSLGLWREIEWVGKDRVIIEPSEGEDDDQAELIAMFRKFDTDCGGSIDTDELTACLGELGIPLDTAEAADVLARYTLSMPPHSARACTCAT